MRNKDLFVMLLALCMVFGLLAGCGDTSVQSEPTTEPQQTTEATLPPLEGTMELSTAADLQAMASNPVKTYVLKQDIDMGGAEWTGLAGFRSVFEGNGHTISNVTIVAAAGSSDLGFFADITAEGEVKDLNLVNVTIDASATSAKNIGTVAGTNAGKITNCTATGIITDTREDAMSVGALVGTAAAGATVEGGTGISVTDDAGVYTTEGLAADVKLFVADHENVKRGLVGTAAGATVTGLWRDRFYSSERNSSILQERQKIVVDYYYEMSIIEWTVSEPMKYSTGEATIHEQTFEPGVTYYGPPYAHRNASSECFQYALDENGQIADWIMEEVGGAECSNDSIFFATELANNCSSAFGWAWLRVSPVDPFREGVHPGLTYQLVPVSGNVKMRGVYAVGQMQGDSFDAEDAAYQAEGDTTSDIIAFNGADVILEAYAMTRKADGLVYRKSSGGHVRMVSVDPIVIRNPDGSIDADLSYFITIEQGDGLYDRKYLGTTSSWRTNYRYTFEVLMNGSQLKGQEKSLEAGTGKGYIPITMRPLREDKDFPPYIQMAPDGGNSEITAPERGSFSSNYRILSSQVIVKDGDGTILVDNTAFALGRSQQNNKVEMSLAHDGITKDLAPGEYTFTVIATLSDGSVHYIVQDQVFQKK